jgi:hypothetical protein
MRRSPSIKRSLCLTCLRTPSTFIRYCNITAKCLQPYSCLSCPEILSAVDECLQSA